MAQLWPFMAAAGGALAVVVGGLAFWNRSSSSPAGPDASAREIDQLASQRGLDHRGLDRGLESLSPVLATAKGWHQAEDLSRAIAITRPLMTDTIDQLDEGAATLALWASERMTWAALSALPETSPALYRKDPEQERGKRLCATGIISEVRAERNLARRLESDHPLPLPAPANGGKRRNAGTELDPTSASAWEVPQSKVFFALLDTRSPTEDKATTSDNRPPALVLSAIAVGSTGQLVDGDRGRVCGVLTGVNLVKNGSRPDVLTHRVVGMFDLPENRVGDAAASDREPPR